MEPRACAAVLALIASGIAAACAARCLDDATDAAFVDVVRSAIADACPCPTAPAERPHYRRCVRDLLKQSVVDGMLPRACRALVKKSTTRSVCGRLGSVPCCAAGADGAPTCKMVSQEACLGRVGDTASCYDACSALPSCDRPKVVERFASDEALAAARDAATAKWTGSGREADYTDDVFRRWLHSQLAAEMGCREDIRTGTTLFPAAASVPRTFSPSGSCGFTDCVGGYDGAIKYCGSGQGHRYNVRCDDCTNAACWRHDGCTGELCIRAACQFQGNADCDTCFFDQTADCLSLARSDCQHGHSGRCAAATCMERVRAIARWWGNQGQATPACQRNRTACAGPNCCSGCAGGMGMCSSVDPAATQVGAARVEVFHWPPEGCTDATACSECGWCLAPGWDTGCSLLVQVGVGYWKCNGAPLGSCHGQYLVPKACGKDCGVDQECDPAYGYRVALQQVNDCASVHGWPSITGIHPDGRSTLYFDQECCAAPPT